MYTRMGNNIITCLRKRKLNEYNYMMEYPSKFIILFSFYDYFHRFKYFNEYCDLTKMKETSNDSSITSRTFPSIKLELKLPHRANHLINREGKTLLVYFIIILYQKLLLAFPTAFYHRKVLYYCLRINSLSVTSVFFTTSHASKLRLIIAHVKAAAWIINRILYSPMFRIKLWRFHKELLTFNRSFRKTKRNKMLIHSRGILLVVKINIKEIVFDLIFVRDYK